jgi:tRNA pseudouridine65 synthase
MTTSNTLQILYQDEYFIAINKPGGLLVHRSEVDRRETRFALQIVRDQIGQRVYPVHRLDKPTSGVLLFALRPESARKIMEHFQIKKILKTYTAVVRGYADKQGCIDYPLQEELDKMTDRKAQRNKPAQAAVTQYRRLDSIELPLPVGRYTTTRYSLLSVTPHTGRKHQIRRHMKHIYHPIVGDTTYGDGRHNAFFRQQFGCHGLLLAATGLSLPHPYSGEQLSITALPEAGFMDIMDRFQWQLENS